MQKKLIFLIVLTLSISCTNSIDKKYPIYSSNNVIESYHNIEVEDKYRGIENIKDSSVINFLKEQEEYSTKKIKNHPAYNILKEKNDNINQEFKNSIYRKIRVTSNSRYFYLKKDIDDEFSKIYYRNGFEGEEKLIFDPLDDLYLKKNVSYIQPNINGSKLIIGLTNDDREFCDLHIIDVDTKEIHNNFATNALPNSLGGVNWLNDSSGFIYTYVPVINNTSEEYLFNSKSVLYSIESNEYKDIFSKESSPYIGFKKEDFPLVYTSPESSFVLGENASVSRYRDTYYTKKKSIYSTKNNWKKLFDKDQQIIQFLIDKDDLIYRTSKGASNFKICKTSLINPNFEKPEILVESNSTETITNFAITKHGLFYITSKNGVEIKIYSRNNDGMIREYELPNPSGYAYLLSNGSSFDDLWLESEGWLNSPERYKFNFENNIFKEELFNKVNRLNENYRVIVEEIEIPSYDGIMLPLSIIYKKGTLKNGKNSLLLRGYGAYGVSETPYLDPYLKLWLEEGGIYAVAHVRGGGEKGDSWHQDGKKMKKENTWEDFISAAEYLIKEKYTSKTKLAAISASAGGIMLGKAITEKPELFSAAVIQVGIMNPLRLHKMSNGLNNAKEFGDINDYDEFIGLLKMDPYHTIKNKTHYPAVMITCGLNDARVPAWQPAKFATALQEATISNNPILLRVDFEGGHGLDSTNKKRNEELIDNLLFLLWQTGHPNYQLKE